MVYKLNQTGLTMASRRLRTPGKHREKGRRATFMNIGSVTRGPICLNSVW